MWPMTRLRASTRLRIGASLLILFALLAEVRLLRKALRQPRPLVGNDDISLYEGRFEDVKKLLPSHGTVGYVSDGKLDGMADYDSLYLTQYVLSPRVVLASMDCELIVADFRDEAAQVRVINPDRWNLVSGSSSGVKLLRRKSK